jgi:cyclin B
LKAKPNFFVSKRQGSKENREVPVISSSKRVESRESVVVSSSSIQKQPVVYEVAYDDDPMSIVSISDEDISIEEIDELDKISLGSLDKDDMDDPQNVAIYVNDIFKYYKEIEHRSIAEADYMEKQPDVDASMREILVDWLFEVHVNFKLQPQTLFLAVQILDRYLSKQRIDRTNLQLLGCGALLVASKYEETYTPEIADFEYVTKNAYTRDQILDMESHIVNTLGFRLSLPTVFHFLQRALKIAMRYASFDSDLDDEENKMTLKIECFYFAALYLLEYDCVSMLPSVAATSALYLAFCRLQIEWVRLVAGNMIDSDRARK